MGARVTAAQAAVWGMVCLFLLSAALSRAAEGRPSGEPAAVRDAGRVAAPARGRHVGLGTRPFAAQESGALSGTVVDLAGGVLPGVTVTVSGPQPPARTAVT